MELDIFIPDISVGIEYDGLRWHSTETQHLNEKTKYRICKECGVFLIRIKENNKSAWNDVADKVILVEKRRNFAKLNKLISEILSYIVGIYNGAETMNLLNKNISVDVERDQEEIHSYLTEIDESLAELRPDLVEEWDFEKNGRLLPSMFSLHSNDAVWWKCKRCGHSWRSLINSRTRPNGSGCAICGNTQKGTTFHKGYISVNGSLLQNNPELAEEWHPTRNGNLSPDNITVASPIKVWWLCKKCGYEWQSAPNNRNKGVGCPCCSGRVPQIGINDLATVNPTLANEWHPTKNAPLLPNAILPKSGKKVWWLCPECGNEWQAAPHSRSAGHGCPFCSGRVPKIGVNDLATISPVLASEWHPTYNLPLKPNMVLPNCTRKVWWRCSKCAYEWQATVTSRFNGRGCPNCHKLKRKTST